MTTSTLNPQKGGVRDEKLNARAVADWLALAAMPTFAIMGALTDVVGGRSHLMWCSLGKDMSPLDGMVPMYLLMSAFHSTPWLRLLADWQRGSHQL
jgi:hypothetical protein